MISNHKIRFYQNDDVIVLANLKVGSRFCDNVFGTKESADIWLTDENKFVSDKSWHNNNYDKEFKPMKDLLEGNTPKDIYLIYRNPIDRWKSAISHFFMGWFQHPVNIQMSDINLQTKKFFSNYNTFENPYGEGAGKFDDIPHQYLMDIKPLFEKFIEYWSINKLADNHTTNYLYIYNDILNRITVGNEIHLVNISHQRLEDVFDVESPRANDTGSLIHFSSNPFIKDALEEVIVSNTIIKQLLTSEMYHYQRLENARKL